MTETTAGYLPAALARIAPNDLDRSFFEACRRHQLTIQRCDDCGRYQHPPRVACPSCHSFTLDWVPVAATGTVYTYTVAHHGAGLLADYVPYVVIAVDLDDAPVRFVSNLVEASPGEVRVGLPVEVAWDDLTEELVLPRFKPRREFVSAELEI